MNANNNMINQIRHSSSLSPTRGLRPSARFHNQGETLQSRKSKNLATSTISSSHRCK